MTSLVPLPNRLMANSKDVNLPWIWPTQNSCAYLEIFIMVTSSPRWTRTPLQRNG